MQIRATETSSRFLINAAWLFGGNGGGALLGLVATVLAARLLGPAEFGVMALITTYVNLVDRLVNFQTWQALIRYGARARTSGDDRALKQLVKVCALIDLGGALVGALLAYLASGLVADLLSFGPEETHFMALFSFVIAARVIGTPTALLRLFNRFPLLAANNLLLNGLVLIGTVAVWMAGGGLGALLLVVAVAQIAAHLVLLAWGWRALVAEGYRGVLSEPLRGVGHVAPGFLGFLCWTNLESSIKILRELDVFVVRALLDLEAVGLYQIARRIAQVFELAAAPFTYAIYPEFSRQLAAGDRPGFLGLFRTSAVVVGSVATLGWVALWSFGEPLIAAAFGAAYVESYLPALLCALGSTVWAWAQPVSPAMFSLGLADRAFRVHLAVAILYLCAMWLAIPVMGLAGAGAAYAMFHIVWSGVAALVVCSALRKGPMCVTRQ